jgi:hypothetical protein
LVAGSRDTHDAMTVPLRKNTAAVARARLRVLVAVTTRPSWHADR